MQTLLSLSELSSTLKLWWKAVQSLCCRYSRRLPGPFSLRRNILCCYLRHLKFANLSLGHVSWIMLKWIAHFHMVTAWKVVFSAQAYSGDFFSKCKRDMLWLSCLFLKNNNKKNSNEKPQQNGCRIWKQRCLN